MLFTKNLFPIYTPIGKIIINGIVLKITNQSTIPAKKLKMNAYVSVKKNKAANDPLIIAGCILVTSKKSATGIPPNVVKLLSVPDIIPVKNFPKLLFIFWFEYPFINKNEKKIIVIQTAKWVILGSKCFSSIKPIGEPNIIPINIFETKTQSILLQIYGIIKILIKTSRINIIGTISIAGRIKENPEIHIAEKPNPLNPLIIDAMNTVNEIKKISVRLNWK